MMILGIDPGMTVGAALLDTSTMRVPWAVQATDDQLADLRAMASASISSLGVVDAIVCEEWISYGRPPGEGSRMAIGQGYWLAREQGALLMSRPKVIHRLGMAGSQGKAAVWGEVVRCLGSDKGGKLCPKRNNKSHVTYENEEAFLRGSVRPCDICSGTGWERQPGPLAHVKGHARDALALALARAMQMGLL